MPAGSSECLSLVLRVSHCARLMKTAAASCGEKRRSRREEEEEEEEEKRSCVFFISFQVRKRETDTRTDRQLGSVSQWDCQLRRQHCRHGGARARTRRRGLAGNKQTCRVSSHSPELTLCFFSLLSRLPWNESERETVSALVSRQLSPVS